ncbi:LytTR family DNA-binding domain-containing protein [Opitutaceae bacterium]|jgi:two-component system LytT family response regulator
MKTLLIDDEELPRRELRRMLERFPQIEVIGEAADATEARALIARLRPELLFLDVHMPEESGLELLGSLQPAPQVIFVTAHDQHALQAFEFGAIDYLLKPVEAGRLAKAVERLGAEPAESDVDVAESAADDIVPLRADQKVLLRDGDRTWFVPVATIHGAESCGAYAKLWLERDTPVIHRSLAFLEKRLPPALFFRASRNEMVNIQSVTSVEPWFSGGLRLTLKSGRQVEVSRRQSRAFRERTQL